MICFCQLKKHILSGLPVVTVLLALLLAGSGDARANCQLHEKPTVVTDSQGVELPTKAGEGPEKEAKVLLETSAVKLAVLTLRRGFVLPAHDAPVSVTIQALSGSGVVRMGGTTLPIDARHMVVLSPKVSHEVIPDKGGDLVLLLHYLKGTTPSQASEHEKSEIEKSAKEKHETHQH